MTAPPMANKCIYLDAAASTPVDSLVIDSMLPWFINQANPHATQHTHGIAASNAIKQARLEVATSIAAESEEIIFTSGATEANNLAIHGIADYLIQTDKTHIIASTIEHASVLEPLKSLAGFDISLLAPQKCGMLDIKFLEQHITSKTGLICLQAVNNEIGVIQPICELQAILDKNNILLLSDLSQAIGKININVSQARISLASISSHKLHGPQGVGALYVNRKLKDALKPLQLGGGQEDNLRSGTLSVALCVGFGKACSLLTDQQTKLRELRELFLAGLSELKPTVYEHPMPDYQAPGIISLRFTGIGSDILIMETPGLSFGVGSTCTKFKNQHSHTIATIAGEEAAKETIRISLSRMSSIEDVMQAVKQLVSAVSKIRLNYLG